VVPRARAVLASEDAMTEEQLAAHHEQFAAALDELEGRAEFVVQGRYLQDAVAGEAVSQNEQATRLLDTTQGRHRGAAREAGTGPAKIITEAGTARREQDTRTLAQAMDRHCVACVARQPAHELDAVHAAFLVEAGQRGDMERVAEDLAREWEGRIEVQLLGPMAAYDFTAATTPKG
jgi:Gas vesicle synthesis protein GvpL/GvpF